MTPSQKAAALATNAARISTAQTELKAAWLEEKEINDIVPIIVWRLTLPAEDASNHINSVAGASYDTNVGDLATHLISRTDWGTDIIPDSLTPNTTVTIMGLYRPAAVPIVNVYTFEGVPTDQPQIIEWVEVAL